MSHSFPGGKMDECDSDIIATAIRECQEETGAAPVDILGLWHDVPNKDKSLSVTPVVAWMGSLEIPNLRRCVDEVSGVTRSLLLPSHPVHPTFYFHACIARDSSRNLLFL